MLREKRRNEKDFGIMCKHWICFPWKAVVSKTSLLIFRDRFCRGREQRLLESILSFLDLQTPFFLPENFSIPLLVSALFSLLSVQCHFCHCLDTHTVAFFSFSLRRPQYKECEAFLGSDRERQILNEKSRKQALKFQWKSLKFLDII